MLFSQLLASILGRNWTVLFFLGREVGWFIIYSFGGGGGRLD